MTKSTDTHVTAPTGAQQHLLGAINDTLAVHAALLPLGDMVPVLTRVLADAGLQLFGDPELATQALAECITQDVAVLVATRKTANIN